MTTPVTDSLARRLHELERRVNGRLAEVLHRGGSSLDEWRVLTLLTDVPARPMGEIAGLEGLTGPTLSRIVERLVAAGFVYREIDTRDRRRVLVGLVAAGRVRHSELTGLVAREQAGLRYIIGAGELDELERLLSVASLRLRAAETSCSGP